MQSAARLPTKGIDVINVVNDTGFLRQSPRFRVMSVDLRPMLICEPLRNPKLQGMSPSLDVRKKLTRVFINPFSMCGVLIRPRLALTVPDTTTNAMAPAAYGMSVRHIVMGTNRRLPTITQEEPHRLSGFCRLQIFHCGQPSEFLAC